MSLTREEAIAAAQAAWRWPVGRYGGQWFRDDGIQSPLFDSTRKLRKAERRTALESG